MTQTRDLIKKMADFFKSEEYYEKSEDARLELSPDDVRCMNRLIQRMSNLEKIRAEIEQTTSRYTISRERGAMGQVEWSDRLIKESEVLEILDKYKAESEESE